MGFIMVVLTISAAYIGYTYAKTRKALMYYEDIYTNIYNEVFYHNERLNESNEIETFVKIKEQYKDLEKYL